MNTHLLHSTARLLMDKQSLSRPTSTASLITTASSKNNDGDNNTQHIKPKIRWEISIWSYTEKQDLRCTKKTRTGI